MDRGKIIENGWHQGAVFLSDELPEDARRGLSSGSFYIVASQSCDVVNPSLEEEPNLEIVQAMAIDAGDDLFNSGFFNAKSPRRLIVDAPASLGKEYFLLSVQGKIATPRDFVEKDGVCPHSILDDSELEIFRTWLAMRYNRASFPDAFTDRINASKNKLAKALGKQVNGEVICRYVEGIYMNLKPDCEVDEEVTYELECFALVPSDTSDEIFRKIEETMKGFVEKVKSKGVSVQSEDGLVMLMSDMTVEQIRDYKRYYLEDLTLRYGEDLGGSEVADTSGFSVWLFLKSLWGKVMGKG